MISVKNILFPFFKKDLHAFLTRQWWFRTVIVLYVIALVISPVVFFIYFMDSQTDWCYGGLYLYRGEELNQQIRACGEISREARGYAIPFALISPPSLHYLVQLIFFKVIVGYIILGGKRHPGQKKHHKH